MFPVRLAVWLSVLTLPWAAALAVDPPHTDNCDACHITHSAPGAALGNVAGNANLCMSCHQPGGSAATKPFVNTDQAIPWPGLPSGTNAAGTSHRWDSGPSGRVQFLGGATTASTGALLPGGTFTGAYAKTYTITISTGGNSGTARFNWTATTPGGGSGASVLTGTNVALNEGITVTFKNGSGTSFQLNDQWNLYVRTDLRLPANTAMLTRITDNLIMCSTCHNQHSQTNAPFDSSAPAYAGGGTGAGRHYQRADNDAEQMCTECHLLRNVTNAVSGSHPVGVVLSNYIASTYPNHDYFQLTTNLPLQKSNGNVRCETCHAAHYAVASDGSLTRTANRNSLCTECHSLAQTDTSLPAAHLSLTNTLMLWPGGQYGSAFPQITDTSKRGTCVNCHQPHGWPDASNPANHYPKLLVDFQENLCFTCHDANGPAAENVMTDFSDRYHHPLKNSEQFPGRSVECIDCHNPHKALAGAHTYSSGSKTITGAANNGSGLIRITATSHGFVNNDTVLLANVGGVTAATGAWRINVITANTFDLQGSTFSGAYTSGGTAMIVANTNRNLASNPLRGVSGVIFNDRSLTNYEVVTTNRYTWVAEATGATDSLGATNEYQICFKCHSGYGFPSTGDGLASFTANSTTVTGSGTAWTANLAGRWIARSNDIRFYVITNVVSATSLKIAPAYLGATASSQNYTIRELPPGLTPIYNTGTATFTTDSTTVTGNGASWNAGMVGTWIRRSNDVTNYKITNFVGATSVQIIPAYAGPTASAQPYVISLGTDVAQEFSPFNKSGHPVVTGLNNYSNSLAVGSPARRGLQPAYLKAPWTNHVGSQTMMCSDCHNTDAASPAAQGPHGSAAQFMLRGTNAVNWPNVTVSNFGTSWCANCHNNFTSDPHSGNHNSYYCYQCHIVIPHGGKVSRLIGNRDTMPARYAWQNNLGNMAITRFVKMAVGSYQNGSSGSCATATCTGDHPTTAASGGETW